MYKSSNVWITKELIVGIIDSCILFTIYAPVRDIQDAFAKHKMSLQTEISSCQGKQVSTLENESNTNNSIVFEGYDESRVNGQTK